ncbi:MAG: hypothetical protein C0391_09965 [Anaerolinea sp.]|nr:hypothetical protein [Anaerolinea sp.]
MRNLKDYARQTNIRLIIGGLLIVFLLGVGLIYLIYGLGAAISGMLCLGIGLIPVIVIMAALWIMEYILRKQK